MSRDIYSMVQAQDTNHVLAPDRAPNRAPDRPPDWPPDLPPSLAPDWPRRQIGLGDSQGSTPLDDLVALAGGCPWVVVGFFEPISRRTSAGLLSAGRTQRWLRRAHRQSQCRQQSRKRAPRLPWVRWVRWCWGGGCGAFLSSSMGDCVPWSVSPPWSPHVSATWTASPPGAAMAVPWPGEAQAAAGPPAGPLRGIAACQSTCTSRPRRASSSTAVTACTSAAPAAARTNNPLAACITAMG